MVTTFSNFQEGFSLISPKSTQTLGMPLHTQSLLVPKYPLCLKKIGEGVWCLKKIGGGEWGCGLEQAPLITRKFQTCYACKPTATSWNVTRSALNHCFVKEKHDHMKRNNSPFLSDRKTGWFKSKLNTHGLMIYR